MRNIKNIFDLFCHNNADKFIKNGKINKEDRELCAFGISRLIVNLLMISLFTIIGLLLGHLFEIYLFLLFFIPLRKFAGGFHCDGFVSCGLASCACVIAPIVISGYINNITVFFIIWIVSGIIIVIIAPIQDYRKMITRNERLVYRNKTLKISIIYSLICTVAYIIGQREIFKVIVESFGIVSFLLVCGYIKNVLKKVPVLN